MEFGKNEFHGLKQTKTRNHKTHSFIHSFLTSAGAFVSSTFLSSPSSFSPSSCSCSFPSSSPPSTSSLVPSRIYTCFDRISASWLSNSNSSIPDRLPTKLPLPITIPPFPHRTSFPRGFPIRCIGCRTVSSPLGSRNNTRSPISPSRTSIAQMISRPFYASFGGKFKQL